MGAKIEVPRILNTYAVLLKLLCPKLGVRLAFTAKLTNLNSLRAISLKKPFLLFNYGGTIGASSCSIVLGGPALGGNSESLDFDFESSARVSYIIRSSSAS